MKKVLFLLALLATDTQAITLEALIKQHGKDKVIQLISARTNHKLTIFVDGETKIAVAPNPQYITLNTLKADLKRENITADDIANDLAKQNQQYDNEKLEQLAELQARDELLKQAETEKQTKQEAIQQQLENQKKLFAVDQVQVEKEREKLRASRNEAIAHEVETEHQAQQRRESELITEKPPVNYKSAIDDQLKHTLFDPYSVKIESVSEPKRIFIEKEAFGLQAGQLAYLVEIEYNAKNKLGAYTGLVKRTFIFRGESIIDVFE